MKDYQYFRDILENIDSKNEEIRRSLRKVALELVDTLEEFDKNIQAKDEHISLLKKMLAVKEAELDQAKYFASK